METGTVFDAGRSGRPRTSEENIERVRQTFHRSPMKSIRTAARQLELPRSTTGLRKGYCVSNKSTGHD